jgi:eukaryotic-like serine/threonine-protein kinase
MHPLGDSDPRTVGPYRLLAELGRGGMGRVLLGAAPDGRLVAVKQIRPALVEEDGFVARFRREVAASRRVSGAYTAAVVDADVSSATPWLASVFVPGPSLQDTVDAGGVLPEDSVLRLAAGLAAALAEIHRAGLVHRDLKPTNVLLAADGPRVIDFGIARAVDGEATEVTRTGWLIGSPGFMSPEQAEGHALTPASDVFSLGSLLVMACTGASPFIGASAPRTLYNVVHAEPDLTAVPPRVRELVVRCLAKDPAARPAAEQLLASLDPVAKPWPPAVHELTERQQAEIGQLLGGPSGEVVDDVTVARPSPARTLVERPAQHVARPRRWRGGLVAAVAAVVVLAVVGTVLAFSKWLPNNNTTDSTNRPPGSELVAMDAHADAVYGMAFSPDGRLLATGSADGTARLWDVAQRKEIGARLTHPDWVNDVAFSPDSRLLATAGGDGAVRLWDVASRTEAGEPLKHPYEVDSAEFSPDGRLLVTLSSDGVRLWDVASRRAFARPLSELSEVNDVVFSPDGRLLAIASKWTVWLWDVASGERLSDSFAGDDGEWINAVAFSPDGRTLAAAAVNGVTTLWEVATHQRRGRLAAAGEPSVTSVVFSPDGRIVVTVSDAVRLWEVAGAKAEERPVAGTVGVAVSPDSRTVVTGGRSGTVWLYRLPADWP